MGRSEAVGLNAKPPTVTPMLVSSTSGSGMPVSIWLSAKADSVPALPLATQRLPVLSKATATGQLRLGGLAPFDVSTMPGVVATLVPEAAYCATAEPPQ